MYDVCWSPIHPAVFASVDGTGKLDLWHLNKDPDMPSASIEVHNGGRALNKLKWSRHGTEIAVGDDHGQITIFEINESFARPVRAEEVQLLDTVNNFKQLNYEMEQSTSAPSYFSDTFRQ